MIMAVNYDLAHNFCMVGGTVYEQVNGCPIGGLLSAFYANVYCAHDEQAFLRKWEHLRQSFYAIRQMDDLIFVIVMDDEDEEHNKRLLEMRT